MPDMNQPLAHMESLMDDFTFRARKQRQDAAAAMTRAEIYEEAARDMESAIRKEREKVK